MSILREKNCKLFKKHNFDTNTDYTFICDHRGMFIECFSPVIQMHDKCMPTLFALANLRRDASRTAGYSGIRDDLNRLTYRIA